MRKIPLVFLLLALVCPAAWSAEGGPASFVGLTLADLIARFGAPRSVYAVRGLEEWQDDVVFVYEQGDFYVFKDRVWQIGLKEVPGIKAGDSRAAALDVLGGKAESRGGSIFVSLDDGNWPLELRCNFDEAGKVTAVFIYRTDL